MESRTFTLQATPGQMDCGPRCRSKQHALELITAVTRGSTRQIQLFLSRCHNATMISDSSGRTVLHMAASRGQWEVVEWLLSECKVEIGARDTESGWTPLHRALFYGQLHAARLLVKHGASLQVRDKEGLTPLDIIMKDRLPHVEFLTTDLNEVFTWGDNSNSTLGQEKMQARRQPEVVDFFRKNGVNIKEVSMSKYHTVFRSSEGKVYTCGHGRGGRLGHGNEQTCLLPELVKALEGEECVQVSSARDHTVFLTKRGMLYSCGLNDSHQLGLLPTPASSLLPRQVTHRHLKGRVIKGVCAQRFHTVVYTSDAVFTFGLNAGQLGHLKVPGEKYVSQPRQVSALNNKDIHIKVVACSDAATVIFTTRGDIYTLHEYQCRKVVSKSHDVVEMAVCGGHLDHSTDIDTLREQGGTDLTIVLLNSAGRAFLWRASDPCLRRCVWSIQRHLQITKLAVSMETIAFVTRDGEAFLGGIPRSGMRRISVSNIKGDMTAASHPDTFNVSVTDLIERDDILDVRIARVPIIHRATGVVMDRKGNNFAVLQSQPNVCLTEVASVRGSQMIDNMRTLLEETDQFDTIHDVILEVGNERIPAHRYILAIRSDYFRKVLTVTSEKQDPLNEVPAIVRLENISVDLLRQMLRFMYTDTCDLLNIGSKFTLMTESASQGHNWKISSQQEEQKRKKKTKGEEKKDEDKKTDKEGVKSRNPVRLLQDMARKFGVKNLAKRLEAVKYVNGVIQGAVGRHLPPPRPHFDRTKFGMLHDVCIRGDSGEPIPCHKCILVARLEYFHSMLCSGWIETSSTEALTLPVPGNILNIVLDFLYSDSGLSVEACEDVEMLCNVLVVADQLLINRLKDITEVAIASLLTLRNVCEVLEFASVYNANQLKATCQQYICLNLAAAVEGHTLDVLSDEVMEGLTMYYRNMVSGMCRRQVTPYADWPDATYLESLESKAGLLEQTQSPGAIWRDAEPTGKKNKGRRRRARTKSSDFGIAGDEGCKESGDSHTTIHTMERTSSVSSELELSMELEEVAEEERHLPEPSAASGPNVSQPLPIPRHGSWPAMVQPQSPPVSMGVLHVADCHFSTSRTGPTGDADVGSSSVSPPPGDVAVTVHPGLAHSPPGLRDIMAEQDNSGDHRRRAAKSPSGTKKVGKLSQRERKKLAGRGSTPIKEELRPADEAESMKETVRSAPTGNPWASVNSMVSSFKDLMLNQEKEIHQKETITLATSPLVAEFPISKTTSSPVNVLGGPGGDTTLSWGLPTSAVRPGRRSPQPTSSPPPLVSPTGSGQNPWQQHRPLAAARTISFTEIMHDEQEQNATLEKLTNKPLHLIQLEEQAIQELLLHYHAADTVEEFISITREHSHLARPTWAATQ